MNKTKADNLKRITYLHRSLQSSSNKNEAIEFLNEMYSFIDNPENKSLDDYRKDTMLLFIEKDLKKTQNGEFELKSLLTYNSYNSILGLYANYSERIGFIKECE